MALTGSTPASSNPLNTPAMDRCVGLVMETYFKTQTTYGVTRTGQATKDAQGKVPRVRARNWDTREYDTVRKIIDNAIDKNLRIEDLNLENPYVKLALLESASAKSGDTLGGLSAIMKSGTRKQKNEILAVLSKPRLRPIWQRLKRADTAHTLTLSDQRELVYAAYEIAHPVHAVMDLPGLRGISNFIFAPGRSKRELIRRRVMTEIVANDLESAVQNLGIARDSGTLEKFRIFSKKTEPYREIAVSTALNYFSVKHLGLPWSIPSVPATRLKKVTESVQTIVREKGFDAAYPELKKIYGNYAGFEQAWTLARSAYAAALTAYVGLFILENHSMMTQMGTTVAELGAGALLERFPELEPLLGGFAVNEKSIIRLQEENFSASRIREEQFLSSLVGGYYMDDRYPDFDSHKEDRQMWDHFWRGVLETPDEELKIAERKTTAKREFTWDDPSYLRGLLLLKWTHDYRAANGEWPDPDSEEFSSKWSELQQTSWEKLRENAKSVPESWRNR